MRFTFNHSDDEFEEHPHHRHSPDFSFEFPPFFLHRFGPMGPGGFGPRGPHTMRRGDLKYLLLHLLNDHPQHGYELIKTLEDRFNGFYSPSPGIVYPTLQLLEDRGWAVSAMTDGKKIYTITEAGKTALQEHHSDMRDFGPWGEHAFHHEPHDRHEHHGHHEYDEHDDAFEGRHGPGAGFRKFFRHAAPEYQPLAENAAEIMFYMRRALHSVHDNPERMGELLKIITKTRDALRAFADQSAATGSAADESGPDEPPPAGTETV